MKAGIKTALIGGGATVLAAIIPLSSSWRSPAKVESAPLFTGVVDAQGTRKPIEGAEVLIAQDQSLPEVVHTDDNGYFTLKLHPGVTTLKINVSAPGYVPVVRNASPSRTGPEEFYLTINGSNQPHHTTAGSSKTQPAQKATQAPPQAVPPQPATQQGGVNEHCTGNCVGVNNGVANFYTLGSPPPPVRNVDPNRVTDAIATLRVAPKGTTVRFDAVGTSSDLMSFVNQLGEVFHLGDWAPSRGIRTYHEEDHIYDSNGEIVSHGEGIRCYAKDPNLSFIVNRALQQLGYSCGYYDPQDQNRIHADVYLSIGPPQQ